MSEISKATRSDSQDKNLQPSGGVQSSSSSAGQGNIRVLFYYTAKVAARNNVNSIVANILSELNTSIDLSRINSEIDFTSAGTIQLASNLDNQCRLPTIHNKMVQRSYPFQNINSNLNSHSGDLALIIATTEPSYGQCFTEEDGTVIGRVGGVAANIFTSVQPLAMTTDTYALGGLTALHEIGHVIGGNHEIEMDVQCLLKYGEICSVYGDGSPAYGRGKVNSTDSWQTIMGGYWGCEFIALPSQASCIRLNRWSNPAISYQGESTGVYGESDMESALEITAPIVSGWTTYPTPAPTTSPTISDFGSCSQISWGFIWGSTHYQAFKSTSSSFPGGGNRLGITIFPGFSANIPFNQTEYFRVRACNGNGCGPYSNTFPLLII